MVVAIFFIYNDSMKRKFIVFTLLFSLFFAPLFTTRAHHVDEHIEENPTDISVSTALKLTQEIGFFNTLRLVTQSSHIAGPTYHLYLDQQPVKEKSCDEPNKWYIHDGNPEYCQQLINIGLTNIVCGETCPAERQTGLECSLEHKCCRPEPDAGQAIPNPKQEQPKKFFGLCGDESAPTIQYCFLNFFRNKP